MPCFFYFSRGLLKSQFLDTGLKTSCVGGDSQESSGCQTDSEKVKVLLFWGRCSVCAALPGAVIRFINAGITRDGSSPRLLTHSVASFLSWEPLELPLSLFLSPPSASLTRLSCLFVSQTISLLFPPSLISLSLSVFPSPSLLPSLASPFFFQTLLLPPCHFCLCLPLPLSLSPSVCACRHQWQPQTGRPSWPHKVTWNTRWEKKCQGDNSRQPLGYVMRRLESCQDEEDTLCALTGK